MVKRRRKFRQPRRNSRTQSAPRRSRRRALKDRVMTASIWALGLINLLLIASVASEFFKAPNEKSASINSPSDSKRGAGSAKMTVEVLNACGVPGLANEITQYLRDHDFDVVTVGNYQGGFDLDQTFVIDRLSLGSENALKVADVLGVNKKQVAPQMDESLQLMVTVLIGKDYKKLKVYDRIRDSKPGADQ